MEPSHQSDDPSQTDNQLGVFGFGNPLRGDDGIVPVLFDRIRAQEAAVDATLVEFGSRTFRVVHALRDFDRVLLVDAMRFGGEPGAVVVCSSGEVSSRSETTGSHELDLLELVELATQLENAPTEIRIFGIQPGPVDMDSALSDPVENRLPEIHAELMETLTDF
ncbi:hydrogenase maturation protease [Halodesulfurarchaeum sp.]|uniref:hydrogenase maturation protease n=1 Tax=Halodesulfurarchaeum sp. TaxID=1980530 RepID=UPI002FC3C7D5